MVQVIHPFGFLMFVVERSPNYGQEFITLNRLLQESFRAGIQYTFLVCLPVTPRQHDHRDGRKIEVCFQYVQDNEPIAGW